MDRCLGAIPAAGGGVSQGGDEGSPRLCGSASPEWSESVPVRSSAKRFEAQDPRSGSGGKSQVEGEGALDGTSGSPAGVCVAASIMLALCASIPRKPAGADPARDQARVCTPQTPKSPTCARGLRRPLGGARGPESAAVDACSPIPIPSS